MIKPGDQFPCAICTSGVVEIFIDANPDTIDQINEHYGDLIPTFLCPDCAEHIAGKAERRRIVVWTGQAQ